MKQEDFESLITRKFADCAQILITRGAHYASNKDFLENFKHTAVLMNEVGFTFHNKPVTPEMVCLLFELIKVQRWGNRIRENKDPMDDNLDGINYHLLGIGCRVDTDEEKVEK